MNTVNVNRDELLTIVQENRTTHRDIFLRAQDKYRDAIIKELDAMLAEARDGKRIRRAVNLVEPTDHTDDYDRVIRMLEMSTDDVIALTAMDFDRYVRDQWEWKQQWTATNTAYLAE